MTYSPVRSAGSSQKYELIPNAEKITSKRFLEEANLLATRNDEHSLVGVYLLSGPPGVDKMATARFLARMAACLGSRDASCVCRHCVSGLGSCPDVRIIMPNDHGNLLAGSIDGLESFFSSYPTSGASRKFLVVEGIEKATKGAADSLLKILEGGIREPDTALFVSSYPSKIPLTLRSRMAQVRFRGQSEDEIEGNLGSSSAATAVSKTGHWLSMPVSGDYQVYLSCRKVLPSVISWVMASDVSKAWKACKSALTGPDSSVAMAEVLREAMTDILSTATTGMECRTITSGLPREVHAHALSWGNGVLASLADDLSFIIRGRINGQDCRVSLYRWIVKACSITKSREFPKLGAEEKALSSFASSDSDFAIDLSGEDNDV